MFELAITDGTGQFASASGNIHIDRSGSNISLNRRVKRPIGHYALVRVHGVLFDSGDTLLRPIGGRWNRRFDFEEVVLHHAPEVQASMFPAAFVEGERFLEHAETTPNRDDYHRVMLRVLGIDASVDLLTALNRPLDGPAVEPFPEVRARLLGCSPQAYEWRSSRIAGRISKRCTSNSACVSSSTGSQSRRSSDAASQTHACTASGSELVDLPAEDCVFVDDDAELVAAAIALGYKGLTICRDVERPADVPSIESVDELVGLIGID